MKKPTPSFRAEQHVMPKTSLCCIFKLAKSFYRKFYSKVVTLNNSSMV